MKCPFCEFELLVSEEHDNTKFNVVTCSRCERQYVIDLQSMYMYDCENVTDKEIKNNIPEMRVGTLVVICNKEHPFFLEQGEIVDRDHRFYRVKFKSLNKNINGTCLWLPDHWVDPLPNELKSKLVKK